MKKITLAFSANYTINDFGDYKSFMNELSFYDPFRNSGIELGLNYVNSSSASCNGEQTLTYNYDTGHNVSYNYGRVNYFITPIRLNRLQFGIGAGSLFGLLAVSSGNQTIQVNDNLLTISSYESFFDFAYNLKLHLIYIHFHKTGNKIIVTS